MSHRDDAPNVSANRKKSSGVIRELRSIGPAIVLSLSVASCTGSSSDGVSTDEARADSPDADLNSIRYALEKAGHRVQYMAQEGRRIVAGDVGPSINGTRTLYLVTNLPPGTPYLAKLERRFKTDREDDGGGITITGMRTHAGSFTPEVKAADVDPETRVDRGTVAEDGLMGGADPGTVAEGGVIAGRLEFFPVDVQTLTAFDPAAQDDYTVDANQAVLTFRFEVADGAKVDVSLEIDAPL